MEGGRSHNRPPRVTQASPKVWFSRHCNMYLQWFPWQPGFFSRVLCDQPNRCVTVGPWASRASHALRTETHPPRLVWPQRLLPAWPEGSPAHLKATRCPPPAALLSPGPLCGWGGGDAIPLEDVLFRWIPSHALWHVHPSRHSDALGASGGKGAMFPLLMCCGG